MKFRRYSYRTYLFLYLVNKIPNFITWSIVYLCACSEFFNFIRVSTGHNCSMCKTIQFNNSYGQIFSHKNKQDALIQFVGFLLDIWNIVVISWTKCYIYFINISCSRALRRKVNYSRQSVHTNLDFMWRILTYEICQAFNFGLFNPLQSPRR